MHSGVISQFSAGGSVHVAFFEEPATPGMVRLASVAIWRGPDAPRRWSVRRVLRRLRSRFGPLGLGLHFRWNSPRWTGSAGADGEQQTLFDPERRIVRVLGRDHPLPDDGRTLVLLVDERASAGRAPRVTVRRMIVPPVASENPLGDGPHAAGAPWIAFLQRDLAVRDFMAPAASSR